jgi:hypothetical protein
MNLGVHFSTKYSPRCHIEASPVSPLGELATLTPSQSRLTHRTGSSPHHPILIGRSSRENIVPNPTLASCCMRWSQRSTCRALERASASIKQTTRRPAASSPSPGLPCLSAPLSSGFPPGISPASPSSSIVDAAEEAPLTAMGTQAPENYPPEKVPSVSLSLSISQPRKHVLFCGLASPAMASISSLICLPNQDRTAGRLGLAAPVVLGSLCSWMHTPLFQTF